VWNAGFPGHSENMKNGGTERTIEERERALRKKNARGGVCAENGKVQNVSWMATCSI
jgi:hypothetical protein